MKDGASPYGPISQNFPISHRITIPAYRVTGVSLNGVNPSVFHPLYNTHMVGDEGIASIPLEEDEHPRFRDGGTRQPLVPRLEPVHAGANHGEFGKSSAVQQSTLVSAPGNENGAPLHSTGKTIPAPIGRAAYVAHLGLSNCYQVPILSRIHI